MITINEVEDRIELFYLMEKNGLTQEQAKKVMKLYKEEKDKISSFYEDHN